ncbi:hypothetical protein M0R04_07285 [Candidatus Dojkabacteria bacterium]|jgi:hypothetical protein|nr:hypothetical protein [Candidatus Dojkabacteria bacterium]
MKLNEILIPILPHNHRLQGAYDRYLSEYEDQFIVMDQQFLKEGELASHPRELVVRKLRSQFSNSVYIYPLAIDPNNILIEVAADRESPIHKLEQFITNVGWFISTVQIGITSINNIDQAMSTLKTKDYGRAIITIEPIRGVNIVTPTWIYHVTPSDTWQNKIKRFGLSPRSKSVIAFHPSRVYFTTTLKAAVRTIPTLASERIKQSSNEIYNKNKFNPVTHYKSWAILQIDTSKIPNIRGLGYFKLYKDPNVDEEGPHMALYSLNYVPPEAITLVKHVYLK